MSSSQTSRRPYEMTARAESVERTRERIVEAAWSLRDPRQMTIAAVATIAGISERTVLRHFGSRDGLIRETIETIGRRIEDERLDVEPGDIDGAVANLVDHYERHSDHVLARLAAEGSDERLDRLTQAGREFHATWTRTVFAPQLSRIPAGAERRRRLAQLKAVCDVYFWKLLRRDSGLGVDQTRQAIAELVREITGENP